MAKDRSPPQALPGWRRVVEWGLLVAVIALLVWVFSRHARELQGQAERAAVQSTLGALRTALIIDHLHHSVAPQSAPAPAVTTNPFELLQRPAPNYRGEVSASQTQAVPSGSWVYDPACACIGYRPLDDAWLDSPSGNPMAWFALSGAPGPLQLRARETYAWQGAALD